MLVRARVNHADVRLIFDTGSAHTILRPSAAGVNPAELDVPHVGVGVMGDAVGREVTLEIGSWSWRRRVSVMDLSAVTSAYREKIDGLLGMDFALEFSQVSIELRRHSITFVP